MLTQFSLGSHHEITRWLKLAVGAATAVYGDTAVVEYKTIAHVDFPGVEKNHFVLFEMSENVAEPDSLDVRVTCIVGVPTVLLDTATKCGFVFETRTNNLWRCLFTRDGFELIDH